MLRSSIRRPIDAISKSSRWISPSNCFRIGLGSGAAAGLPARIRFGLLDHALHVDDRRVLLGEAKPHLAQLLAQLLDPLAGRAGRLGCRGLRRIGPRQCRGRAGKLGLELVALPSAGLKLVLKLADVELRRLKPAVHDVLVAQLLGIDPAELRHLGLRVAQPLLIVGDLGIDEPPRPLDIAPAVADILLDEDLEQRLDDGMGQFGVGILELDIEDLAALAGEPDALFQPGQQRLRAHPRC